jgi:electron transfer flavoprotein beta subunit
VEIVVLLKRSLETQDADLVVDASGRSLRTGDLTFGASEWDDHAVEEAVRLKEAHGGTVTVLTVGDDDAEEVLRRALAMGADAALHLVDPAFEEADPGALVTILAAGLEGRPFDLVLCGAVSADEGHGQTGGLLAGRLDLPFVALATAVSAKDGSLSVRHEVEGGLERVVEVDLPAVVSVQTGINEPRYVSIRGIRKVAGVDIPRKGAADLGLAAAVGAGARRIRLEGLEAPPAGRGARMLEGDPEEISMALVKALQDQGGLSR